MLSIKTFLLFTSVTSAAVVSSQRETRDSQILSDLKGLDKSIKTLTTSIEHYHGGVPIISVIVGLPVLGAAIGVHIANRKCYHNALALSEENSEDITAIFDYVKDTISNDIPACVAAAKEKKAQFVDAGVRAIVIGSFYLLKYDHDTFSAVLLEKADPDERSRGEAIANAIHDSIQNGIDYFSELDDDVEMDDGLLEGDFDLKYPTKSR